jgi:hypothetical protein
MSSALQAFRRQLPTQLRGGWDGSGLLLAVDSHEMLIGTDSDHSICIHVYQNTSTIIDRLWSLDRQLSEAQRNSKSVLWE